MLITITGPELSMVGLSIQPSSQGRSSRHRPHGNFRFLGQERKTHTGSGDSHMATRAEMHSSFVGLEA